MLVRSLIAACLGILCLASASSAFEVVNADPPERGYYDRPCGFDMDDDFIYGEPEDCQVGDGVTLDPDNDGVEEDIFYVDCDAGNDQNGDGSALNPYRTIAHAMSLVDGPGDNAEDIIAFAGTCFVDRQRLNFSGVPGHKVRPQSGSESRNFEYPRNPAMLIGWDRDNDGEYPPYDTDDVAILEGGTPHCFERAFETGTSGTINYIELGHFSARRYGTCNAGEAGGFFFLRGRTNVINSHFYNHDLELHDINREKRGVSSRIIFNQFLALNVLQWAAFENIEILNAGAYTARGSADTMIGSANSGPMRYERITRTCLSTHVPAPNNPGQVQCSSYKLWGFYKGMEVIDNHYRVLHDQFIVDINKQSLFVGMNHCLQDAVIRNNEAIDTRTFGGSSGDQCSTRTTRDIVIDRNIWRNTRVWYEPGGFSKATGINMSFCAEGNATVENFTVTNNFLSATEDIKDFITLDCSRNNSPNPGHVVIAGNTFHASANVWTGGIFQDGGNDTFIEDDVTIRNNIVSVPSGVRAAFFLRVPGNFVASNNVYSPGARFNLNNENLNSFTVWQTLTGADQATRLCAPNFANSADGDLHLRSADGCAANFGTDISTFTGTDFDGEARPQNGGWDIGADEVSAHLFIDGFETGDTRRWSSAPSR